MSEPNTNMPPARQQVTINMPSKKQFGWIVLVVIALLVAAYFIWVKPSDNVVSGNGNSSITNTTSGPITTQQTGTTDNSNTNSISSGSWGKQGENLTISYDKVGSLDKEISGISGAMRIGTDIKFFARKGDVDGYRTKFKINTKKYNVQLRSDLTTWADMDMEIENVNGTEYYVLTVPLAGYSYDIFAWCIYLGDDSGGIDKYFQDSYFKDHKNAPLKGWGPNKYGGGNQYYAQLK